MAAQRTSTLLLNQSPHLRQNHRNAKSYSRDFVAVLESAGFVVASTDNPDALELTVGFNPNIFATGFEVQLTQRGIVLIKVDSTNYGWGTGVGRGAAIDNLASNTWRAFADQLDELKPRLTIVSD